MKLHLRTPVLLLCSVLSWETYAQDHALPQLARYDSRVDTPRQGVQKPLAEVLRQLENRYRIFFVYSTKTLEGKVVYQPEAFPADPEELLGDLLSQVNLRFERTGENNYVIVNPRKSQKQPPRTGKTPGASLDSTNAGFPGLNPLSSKQLSVIPVAEFTVAGRVTAKENGEGLPGVNVTVKGTATGTTTDANGNYKLNVPDEKATLVFSYIGYVSEEVPVGGRAAVNVVMVPDIKALSEVVVIGYGTEQRKTLSSAISSVKPEDIQNLPTPRLDNMLQGRAAGVQIIQNNGAPGTNGTTIRIRGISSIRAGSDPLYIVDGIPLGGDGNIEDINPNDIESIEVLKDAAAAAIYGARAANGVILITTKRGSGKPKVTLNANRGIQNIARQYEMLTGPEQWEVMKEMYDNVGRPRDSFFSQVDSTVNTPWSQLLLQDNAPVTDVNLGLRGGEGRVKYATSLSYFDQQGILLKSGFQRLSGRLNLDVEVSKRIRFGNSLSIANTQPQLINTNANGVYMNALVKNPLTPVYDADGRYFFVEPYLGGTGHPLAGLNEIRRDANANRVLGSVFGEADLLKGLTFRTTWGIDYRQSRNSTFTPSTANNQGRTEGNFDNNEFSQWINTNTLNYTRQFGKAHHLSLLAVYEQQEFINRGFSGEGSNFPGDIVSTVNGAAKIENLSANQSSYGLQSLAGRVTYSFKEKYILSANVRRDGSSRFGSNNRFGVFPSVSAAWNVADEPFMKGISFLNYLKVRGSAGQVGNQGGLDNFANRGLYNTAGDFAGEPGILPGAVPNPDLKWETTTQYNVGLEAGVLDERITFVAEAYLKRTDDLLLNRQLAQSSGVGSVTVNLGKLENKGLEFALTTRNLTGALKWTTNLNFSLNRNKVLELYGNPDDVIQVFAPQRTYGVLGLESVIAVGQPLGSVYGYITDGVYARDEDNATGLRHASGHVPGGGDIIYRDLNGDGRITASDRTSIGQMQPLHVGGINNTFSYKGFSLDVFMNWSYGNQIYNATRQALIVMEQPGRNNSVEVRNRWRQPGDVTNIPRAATAVNRANSLESTFFLEDGSYLRVSNISLGYQVPAGFTQRLHLSNLRFYLIGYNPFILTRYKGIDPDVRSFTNEGQYGIDFGAYPRARTFTLGLSLEL